MSRFGPPLFVAVMTFACFLPALGAGYVNWDDPQNFLENPGYRGLGPGNIEWMFTTALMGHYIPVTWLTLGTDYVLWGMDPLGYHLSNVLYHVAAALLLYLVLLSLLKTVWPPAAEGEELRFRLSAAAGALFFSIHPLRVESVAWLTERRDPVSAIFFFLTILAYLRYVRASEGRWLAASAGCFLLALLSKPIVMTLPLVLLTLDLYPLRRSARPARLILEKLPYLALSILFGAVSYLAQKEVGAVRAGYTLLDSVMQPGFRFLFYPWKTLLPFGLSPLYPLESVHSPFNPQYLLSWAAVLAITAGLALWRNRWPAATAAWACYVLMLLPVAGFVHAGPQSVADRFSYLSCLPLAAAAAAGFFVQWGDPAARWKTALAALVVLVGLGALASRQCAVWKDSMSLWNHVIRVEPKAAYAYNNRGTVRESRGDLEGAIADFTEALRLDSSSFQAYANRAVARQQKGDIDGALSDYDEALRLDPTYARAYANRGAARAMKGNLTGALADFDEAVARSGPNPILMNNRGMARRQKGDLDGAIADFTEAIRLHPRYGQAYANRGATRASKGDKAGAIPDFQTALKVSPPDWPMRRQVEQALDALQ
jgi:tetratricopeptide (TPR) repeat protein